MICRKLDRFVITGPTGAVGMALISKLLAERKEVLAVTHRNSKCFNSKVNSYDLIEFASDFRLVKKGDGNLINISKNQMLNEKIGNGVNT